MISCPTFSNQPTYVHWPICASFCIQGIAAGFSEFVAMVLLMILIYTVNWELNFGKYHYWIKQTLTAIGIRYLIETFPTAGPAINPMLG